MDVKKTVCISGADRGIGLELAKATLDSGYIVFAGGIMKDNDQMNKLAQQYPTQLHPFHIDVGSDESVQQASDFIRSKTDKLDLLINNAAILGDISKTIMDPLDFNDIQNVYNITGVGAIRLTNQLIGLIMNGGKLIVNISSEAGSIGDSYRDGWFGYCMAKAALNMGSTIIHNKIRPEGGRVLLLHPGWVKSSLSGTWNDAGTYTPAEAAAHILHRITQLKDELHEQPLYVEADTGKVLPW